MNIKYKAHVPDHRFLLPGYLQPYLDDFIKDFSKNGYTALTMEGYYKSIAHFGVWLYNHSIPLKDINDNVISRFSKHHCHCPGARRIKKVSSTYVDRVRRFVFYLQQEGILYKKDSPKILTPLVIKFKESLHSLGLATATIRNHEISILRLLPLLSGNPRRYNSKIIKEAIYKSAKKCNLPVLKKLTSTLRIYLRFLTVEGICPPNLDSAVPIVAQWRLSSLPKYISTNEVERVISSCDIETKQGLRDRAIILLLARLGLRAGDIIKMLIEDINWEEGTLRVRGKGRRETLLPLPQEVGDALLLYLKKVRPKVTIDRVFLCLNAPYRPFRFPNNISDIVRAGLFRADILNPPSHGASLLRHSAATTMLRNGATLENVSAVLRHRSLDMTAYYAKVDVPMLMKITQPWPESSPC